MGVKPTDIYQMMAYGRLYDCPDFLLLYPHLEGLKRCKIVQEYSIAGLSTPEILFVATVDVSKRPQKVRADLQNVYEKVSSRAGGER